MGTGWHADCDKIQPISDYKMELQKYDNTFKTVVWVSGSVLLYRISSSDSHFQPLQFQLYDAATSFGAQILTPMLIYTIFIYDKKQNIS